VGLCQVVLHQCYGVKPGDLACDGMNPVVCGPDLISLTYREPCARSTSTCVAGECGACPGGAANCDDVPTDCETDLTSVYSCGTGCNTSVSCDQQHGRAACVDSQCEVTSCNSNFADCSDDQAGCETYLNSSASCGKSCTDRVVCSWPTSRCVNGTCVRPPSCEGLPNDCGPAGSESCCDSPVVPHALVSEPRNTGISYEISEYRLDRFEVTVGRFRKFFNAWQAGWRPVVGEGKQAHVRNGMSLIQTIPNYPAWRNFPTYDIGWYGPSSVGLEVSMNDANLQGCTNGSVGLPGSTWTSTPSAGENRPMVCTTPQEAFAFCIWDGGFLPSAAEWMAAARGGEEGRIYPWSQPATSTAIDCTYTDYRCSPAEPARVGAKSPRGDGKYGHADLLGNVPEFVLDATYPATCSDCTPRTCTDCAGMSFYLFARQTVGTNSPTAPGADQVPWYGGASESRQLAGFRCARVP
jgi:formylglycine-generating enzyme